MEAGRGFEGFISGGRATAIPNVFFSALLPKMRDPAELIIGLYLFFLWHNRKGRPGPISFQLLEADVSLREGLMNMCGEDALRRGLDMAVKRGTLLRVFQPQGEAFLLNIPASRSWLEGKQAALADAAGRMGGEPVEMGQPLPDVFILYEQAIGPVLPLIAQDLAEAQERYPRPWIEAAFKEAVRRNRRSWRYIQKILERWALEGPDYEEAGRFPERADRKSTVSGRYSKLVGR